MMSQKPKLGHPIVATGLITAGLLAGIDPGLVQAQATAPDDAVMIQELRQRLEERDVLIGNLLRRVEELERRLDPAAAGRPPAPPPAEPTPASPAAEAPPSEAAQPAPAPAPGQFEVDEEAIGRALGQALVRTGALLLPAGTVEIEPSLSYIRRESSTPVFFPPGGGAPEQLAENVFRSNDLQAAATLRVGLPYDSQLDLFLPYRYQEISTATRVGGAGRREDSIDISGFGDLAIAFTKALVRERGWRPDLFARVQWDADTGQTDDGFNLGSGTNEIGGSVTAVKRQDPLVFIGTLYHSAALEDDGFDPGDQTGLTLGTVLAASPETSLRFLLDQSFVGEAEFAGNKIPGSDQVAASLFIGASSVLGRRLLLDVSAGIGLTEDAPDYSITVSLPIRFDLPFRPFRF
jgi:hypothetical protein